MATKITLAQFVKLRNGVPLGHADSLKNMLSRSLGAGSFAQFWQYWNPVWGYYLSQFVYQPIKRFFGKSIAVVTTFFVSGFLHDLAIMLVKLQSSILLTAWFTFMGLTVVLSEAVKLRYGALPWFVRAQINIGFIGAGFYFTKQLLSWVL
ncbi:acyltransferase [Pseudoalteromonas phenolica]|uniref:Acyltransferase n=2 Tax=Pseudoalteromonas phenolica TaxID=161398 RepID=A0A5R9Q6M7_9GAMM|nr:MBOAT family O-acyltransferase [Pseudoalteromonas phenolica]TLX48803.1 acyltransferase [Pseudoalteromonas phenolica]